jgi:peptide/nickel transport system substrate-binding protein
MRDTGCCGDVKKLPRARVRVWAAAVTCLCLLTGCAATPAVELSTPSPVPPPTRGATPSPTAPPLVPIARTQLSICMTEPRTASPFAPSQSGNDLLALFYEPALERVDYGWEARLVTRVPSLAAGEVLTRLVTVEAGMRYADALGFVRQHEAGSDLQLPQLVVSFTLREDLLWSDGVPITAKDAVLGYHLAQAPEAQGRWRALAERTAQFTALDDRTLRWEGIPGYVSADYPGFLFPLQPAHRWQGQTLAAIFTDHTPPATGPFKIVAWEAHREVRLVRNEYYVGPEPQLEEIVVRFPQYAPESWNALLIDGTCDVILPDPILSTSWQQWSRHSAQGEAIIWADPAPTVLRLDLNLDPIKHHQNGTVERVVSPLRDVQVRAALNSCVGRLGLTYALPAEVILPAASFIPPNHPAAKDAVPHSYNPQAAGRMLDEVGWRDPDGTGLRQADNVPGFTNGEPLSLTLHFASQYFVIAARLAADLETCGIGVDLRVVDAQQLYTPGTGSPLFGRHFDMALLGWQAEIPQVCGVWLSERIPDQANGWNGENFSGFAAEDYDAACREALLALDVASQTAALTEALAILEVANPTLFLAWRPFWFVARPEVKGIRPDVSAYGTLWNSEALSIGED